MHEKTNQSQYETKSNYIELNKMEQKAKSPDDSKHKKQITIR